MCDTNRGKEIGDDKIGEEDIDENGEGEGGDKIVARTEENK